MYLPWGLTVLNEVQPGAIPSPRRLLPVASGPGPERCNPNLSTSVKICQCCVPFFPSLSKLATFAAKLRNC